MVIEHIYKIQKQILLRFDRQYKKPCVTACYFNTVSSDRRLEAPTVFLISCKSN